VGGRPSLQDFFLGAAGHFGARHPFRLLGVVLFHVTLAPAVVKPPADRHTPVGGRRRAAHRRRVDHASAHLEELHVRQPRPCFIGQGESVAGDAGQIGGEGEEASGAARRDDDGFCLKNQERSRVNLQSQRSADGAVLPQEIGHHHVLEDPDAEPRGFRDNPFEKSAFIPAAGDDCTGKGVARIGKEIELAVHLVEFRAVALDVQSPFRPEVGEQPDQLGIVEIVTSPEGVFIMGVPAVLAVDGCGDRSHGDGRDAAGGVVSLGNDKDLGPRVLGFDGGPDPRAARTDDKDVRRDRPLFQCFHGCSSAHFKVDLGM